MRTKNGSRFGCQFLWRFLRFWWIWGAAFSDNFSACHLLACGFGRFCSIPPTSLPLHPIPPASCLQVLWTRTCASVWGAPSQICADTGAVGHSCNSTTRPLSSSGLSPSTTLPATMSTSATKLISTTRTTSPHQ